MRKNICFLLVLVIVSPFLISCWDLTEIEEVGFVMGVGFDPVKNEQEKLKEIEKETGLNLRSKVAHDQLFNVTFVVAIPGQFAAQEGGKTGSSFFDITTTGMTNFNAARQIAARRSRRLDIEHLKAIIINEDLVKGTPMLEHLTDIFIRDHEMRRRTYVFVTPKETKEVLNNKLPLEEMITTSIESINENHDAVLSMLAPTTIGDISTHITGESSFLIPRIIPYDNDMKIAGAAVFLGRENIMLGWLGEEDIKGYNWVMGEAHSGIIEVPYEEDKAALFVFEVITMATTIDYKRENDKNIFHVEIRAEGSFGESWLHDVEISDVETIKKLETQVEEAIKRQATRIIDKMQNEFHADIFGFYNKVRQKQYKYWKTVEDKWDGEGGEFEDAEINIDAEVKIRHYMLNEKVE